MQSPRFSAVTGALWTRQTAARFFVVVLGGILLVACHDAITGPTSRARASLSDWTDPPLSTPLVLDSTAVRGELLLDTTLHITRTDSIYFDQSAITAASDSSTPLLIEFIGAVAHENGRTVGVTDLLADGGILQLRNTEEYWGPATLLFWHEGTLRIESLADSTSPATGTNEAWGLPSMPRGRDSVAVVLTRSSARNLRISYTYEPADESWSPNDPGDCSTPKCLPWPPDTTDSLPTGTLRLRVWRTAPADVPTLQVARGKGVTGEPANDTTVMSGR